MSDHIPDTPNMARTWCPTCEPDADPEREILEVRYCHLHEPARGGWEDSRVRQESYLSGSNEAGGEDNRTWCDLLHRKRYLLRG